MKVNHLYQLIVLVIAFAVSSVAFAEDKPGAGKPRNEKNAETQTTIDDVQKETASLLTTLKQYSVEQRDEAAKKAGEALARLDHRIEELETRVDKNWDTMSDSARKQARENLKVLRQQRTKLAEWYGSLKTSSSGAWQHIKRGFSDAYQSVSEAWEKAEHEYEETTE